MKIRKEDMAVEVKEHLRGGKGSVTMRSFLPQEDASGTGRVFSVATIQPGCSIGYHKHEGEFEIYLMLKGEAKIVDDGQEYILKEGDMMQCKNGSSHSIENETDSPIDVMCLVLFDKN